jgi:hypothetical protein
MDELGDPADELIAMFGKITTTDHDALVTQFSRILNTDVGVARFFLEASSWSVEGAVHTYLAESTNGRDVFHKLATLPVVAFLSDLSRLQSVVFRPGEPIDMEWVFRNDGQETWPADTRLAFVDGERMGGFQSVDLRPAARGEIVSIHQRLIAPRHAGTFAGTWRLVCSAGYFGDPLWIIITVGAGSEQIQHEHSGAGPQSGLYQQFNHQHDDDMMEL